MENADYLKAVKTVQTIKREENYMVINMGYSIKIIVPHKDGLAILNALNYAELFEDPYSSAPSILPMAKDKVNVTLMSTVEYRQYKIASLLGLPVADIQAHEKQAA